MPPSERGVGARSISSVNLQSEVERKCEDGDGGNARSEECLESLLHALADRVFNYRYIAVGLVSGALPLARGRAVLADLLCLIVG